MSHKIIKSILLLCYRLTDRPLFSWFHKLSAKLIEISTLKILESTYSDEFIYLVCARHSIKSSGDFNIFMSDFDFTIVVDDSITLDQSKIIMDKFKRLKKYLWYLDIPEVHPLRYYILITKEQDNLQRRNQKNLVETLRKIRWTFDKLKKNSSSYEFEKQRRSLRKIFRNLEINQSMEQFLESQVLNLNDKKVSDVFPYDIKNDYPGEINYFSDYLFLNVSERASARTGKLTIQANKDTVLLLSAIFSDKTINSDAELTKFINKMRHNNKGISGAHAFVVLCEAASCFSSYLTSDYFLKSETEKNTHKEVSERLDEYYNVLIHHYHHTHPSRPDQDNSSMKYKSPMQGMNYLP